MIARYVKQDGHLLGLPLITTDELRDMKAAAWDEGHDAARTFYAGGPKEPNPYDTVEGSTGGSKSTG